MSHIVIFVYTQFGLVRSEAQSGRTRAGSYEEKKLRFLLASHLFHCLPEIQNCLVFLVVVFVYSTFFHLLDVEVWIRPRNYRIEFLITEHSQPLRLDHLRKTLSEQSSLLLDLLVTLEISITHHELHLVLAKLSDIYLVTKVCLDEGGLLGHSRSIYLF
jgi:hypothetical protein